jgi:phospholipid transport system substrate-binding protein
MKRSLLAVTFTAALATGLAAHAQPYAPGGYGGPGAYGPATSYGPGPGAYGPRRGYGMPGRGMPRWGGRQGMGPGAGMPAEGGEGQAMQATSPDQILRQGIDRLKGFLARGGAAGRDEIRDFLDTEIAPYFDFEYMAQWAAGPLLREMSEEEKAELATRLEDMFFAALARNLGALSDPPPRIEVFPPRMRPYSREVNVTARVLRPGAAPMRMQFRFYRSGEGWKVFDVTANGTSAVAYYRNYFNRQARQDQG